MKLIKKYFINGKIELITGIHIGGSSTALDIGGIDTNVVKNAKGVPYIPGSSIKGKMRSLLEMKYSEYTQETGNPDDGRLRKGEHKGLKKKFNKKIQKLFGSTADEADFKTRIVIRDAHLNKDILEDMKNNVGKFKKLELDYTEAKWENTIDRLTSSANPRQIERVPAGTEFDFSIIFNFYQKSDEDLLKILLEGMKLIEDDYLGGSGTRGYGEIKFKDIEISKKTAENYTNLQDPQQIITQKMLDEIDYENL